MCHPMSLLALVTHIRCSLGAGPALTVRRQLMGCNVRSADTTPGTLWCNVRHTSQDIGTKLFLRVSIFILGKIIAVGPLLYEWLNYAHKPPKWYQFESGFESLEAWENELLLRIFDVFIQFPSVQLCLLSYSGGSRQGWTLARPGELRVRDRCDHLIRELHADWWLCKY